MIDSGLDAMDIRRIEAAILNSGSDFDRTMNPYQAGLDAFIDMKKADFIGKAALAVADRRSMLHGVRCADAEPLILRPAMQSGEVIGLVTAGAWSPYLQCGIGYVRMEDPAHEPGERIEIIGVDGKAYPAECVELPFYDREKKIPRGFESTIPSRD